MSLFQIKAKQSATVLVCAKCFKRTGTKDKLSGPLKKALKRDTVKLVKTRCLGPCPGNAVTLHDSRAPSRFTIVRNGTPIEDVIQSLAGVPTEA